MVFTVVISMCCRGTFGPSRVAVSNEYLSKAIITSRHFPNTKIQQWARVYLIVFVKQYYRYALIMCNVPKQKQNSEEAGSRRDRRRLINWHEIPNPLAERKYGQRQSIIFFSTDDLSFCAHIHKCFYGMLKRIRFAFCQDEPQTFLEWQQLFKLELERYAKLSMARASMGMQNHGGCLAETVQRQLEAREKFTPGTFTITIFEKTCCACLVDVPGEEITDAG